MRSIFLFCVFNSIDAADTIPDIRKEFFIVLGKCVLLGNHYNVWIRL